MPSADEIDGVREEFAETLDAIGGTSDSKRPRRDVSARVRKLVAEQPVPVTAVAIAGIAVASLAAVIVYRVARR
jgi:hypothetical protein